MYAKVKHLNDAVESWSLVVEARDSEVDQLKSHLATAESTLEYAKSENLEMKDLLAVVHASKPGNDAALSAALAAEVRAACDEQGHRVVEMVRGIGGRFDDIEANIKRSETEDLLEETKAALAVQCNAANEFAHSRKEAA